MTWLQDSEQKHAYALSTHSAEPPPHAMQREVPISVEESAPVTSEDHRQGQTADALAVMGARIRRMDAQIQRIQTPPKQHQEYTTKHGK